MEQIGRLEALFGVLGSLYTNMICLVDPAPTAWANAHLEAGLCAIDVQAKTAQSTVEG